MGAEKNSNEARLTKTSSVDLYRPPALRNRDNIRTGSGDAVAVANSFASTTAANATSISCNNSPKHANENNNLSNSVASADRAEAILKQDNAAIVETPTKNGQEQQRQQAVRRERRPDRAVYIPRARRSQTTPPTTQTQQDSTATITTTLTATTLTSPSPSTSTSTPLCSNNATNHQQLPIAVDTSASVIPVHSAKADGIGNKSSSKKSKSGAKDKDRKERVKKLSVDKNKLTINLSEAELELEHTVVLIAPEKTKNPPAPNLNCDSFEPTSAVDALFTKPIENSSIGFAGTHDSIRAQIKTAKDMNMVNSDKSKHSGVEAADLTQLRIEDVVKNADDRKVTKCDIDVQELQRASKEINRSNRRIIKQTFVSDVLEIPEKIEKDSGNHLKGPEREITPPNVTRRTRGNTTEKQEDDWENMFDESGECLDPKIIEELTAAVGKVKIELPKMNYNMYLSKQSILNEEEFPHVLEVSNFPVEFKNQDLLMVFSQYKETGFDIKWVDDTHALAVFSSSRIAAEALTTGHPFVVLKPLGEATIESRLKAKKCAASLQPYRPRPETCTALARRLVTGALGVKLKTAAAERENEVRVLRAAKERKLLAAKQRDEVWDS